MFDLKPCPFCGGEAVDFYRRNTGATAEWCGPVDHWVSCTGDCGAATCMHDTKDEAIAAWNTRHQARAEVVGEIVAWLEEMYDNCESIDGMLTRMDSKDELAKMMQAKFGGRDGN